MSLSRGRRLHGARWALLAALCLAGVATAAQARSVRPYVVRLTLCGHRIGGFTDSALTDRRANYLLLAMGDGKGTSVSLILTPPARGLEPALKSPAALPRLRAGYGVNIGETLSTALAKLGAKPDHVSNNCSTGEMDYAFNRKVRVRAAGRTYDRYRAVYSFYEGRLRAIDYTLYDSHAYPVEGPRRQVG